MHIYIALLRGINVGGKNTVKMSDLKDTFESIGLSRVQTYIQSGNVLFASHEKEDILRNKIEGSLEETFGFSIKVVLRTAAEWEEMIRNCPFSEEEIAEAESLAVGESLYVSLLTHAPAQEKVDALHALKNEGDKYRIVNRDIYLLFRHSIRNSKLANHIQKMDIPSTVRNWKTINKLYTLAKAMCTAEDGSSLAHF